MGSTEQNFDKVYPVAPSILYRHACAAIAAGHFQKVEFDEFTKSVRFQTRATFTSHGHAWEGQILPEGDGARFHLTSAIKHKQLGENRRALDVSASLFADVSRRCAAAANAA